MSTRTITHLFDTYASAADAVTALEAAGIAHSNISVIGADTRMAAPLSDAEASEAMPMAAMPVGTIPVAAMGMPVGTAAPVAAGEISADPNDPTVYSSAAGAGAGATLGTVLGGGAGLLAGIGALAIPGIGPVVAAGWLVATLTGAGAGAAAGGLLGALTGAGFDEGAAHDYAEGVRRGGTLLSVRADESQIAQIEAILEPGRDAANATAWAAPERAELAEADPVPLPKDAESARLALRSPLV